MQKIVQTAIREIALLMRNVTNVESDVDREPVSTNEVSCEPAEYASNVVIFSARDDGGVGIVVVRLDYHGEVSGPAVRDTATLY